LEAELTPQFTVPFRAPRKAASIFLTGIALSLVGSAIVGCGSGGSAPLISAPSRAALTGQVLIPQSQSRGVAHKGRDAATLEPLTGATVTLSPVGSSTPTATTTTDASGNYSFPTLTSGQDYEIHASKVSGSSTIALSAIVTAPPAGTTGTPVVPDKRNLDPDTTVATQAVKTQLAELLLADPTAKSTDLQTVCQEMEKKRKEAKTPAPDLTKPDAVAADSTALLAQTAPDGSYYGAFTGDESGNIGAVIKGEQFFIMSISGPKAGGSKSAHRHNSRADTPPAGSGDNPNGPGNNSGSNANQGGSNTGTHGGGGGFIIGRVNKKGILKADGKDGMKLRGVFTGDVGTGTWDSGKGSKGTWMLARLKDPQAGLYTGHYSATAPGPVVSPPADVTTPTKAAGDSTTNLDPNGSNVTGGNNGGNDNGNSSGGHGVFAVLILDDHSVIVVAGNSITGDVWLTGTGTIDATGLITFAIQDATGASISATGQASGDTLAGTYKTGDGGGTWDASRIAPVVE